MTSDEGRDPGAKPGTGEAQGETQGKTQGKTQGEDPAARAKGSGSDGRDAETAVSPEEGAETSVSGDGTPEEEDGDRLAVQVAELKDRLLRALAEAQNVRRRADRDVEDASNYAITGFARDLLAVADNLRRALDSVPEDALAEAPDDDPLKSLAQGIALTERELMSAFERHGIRPFDPAGEKFDHNFHQVMFEVPHDASAPGTIVQVVQKGYMLKDRLLRPAMVATARPSRDGEGPGAAVDTSA